MVRPAWAPSASDWRDLIQPPLVSLAKPACGERFVFQLRIADGSADFA
jgi:hypothetical protein